jgi:hypothetical protein
MKNIASADTMQPPSIKGILLPSLVHVLSLDIPTMGCTIKPATGAANQNKLRLCGSAPIAERILLVFAFCKEYPICTPKNPKLIFQIFQKLKTGLELFELDEKLFARAIAID